MIDVREVAHTFAAGHRIPLDVASSNFPKLGRNPNAAIPMGEATEVDMQTATQTPLSRCPSSLTSCSRFTSDGLGEQYAFFVTLRSMDAPPSSD